MRVSLSWLRYTPAVILTPLKQFFGVPHKIKAFSSFYLCRIIRARNSYPEMRGQRELTIVAVCTFAYTSG